VLRSPARLAVGFLLGAAALMLWSRAWSALFDVDIDRRALRHGFYLSQLGKYVPGGIWQAAGLVSLAGDAGAPLVPASAAFVVLAVTQVAGAATVGATFAVVAPDLPVPIRLLFIATILLVAFLYRGWMVGLLRHGKRLVKRLDTSAVPAQPAILRSYVWCVGAIVMFAASFTVVAQPHDAGQALAEFSAFATAWWIGFVAIPFPSGVGIREAVLVGALRASVGSGAVLGAAVGQRLVAIAAEFTLIGLTGAGRVRRRWSAASVAAMHAESTEPASRRPLGLAPGAPKEAAGQDARKYATGNPVVQRLITRWAGRLRTEMAKLAPPGAVIADVGVGEGLALARVRPDGVALVGVEYRPDKAKVARDGVDGLAPVVGDAGLLPLRDAAVPLTTCVEVLEHLTDPGPAVEELARVARDGCIVSVPWEPWFRLGNLARGKNVTRFGNDPEHLQFFTRGRLETLLKRHFASVRVVPVFPWLVAVAKDPRR
jgi:SAM-dependent methyltransferase